MKPIDNRRAHKGSPTAHKDPPANPNVSQPSGAWRKKYPCKKNKGEHEFEMAMPHRRGHFEMSMSEYYEMKREKMKKCIEEHEKSGHTTYWCHFYYDFACKNCGKIKLVRCDEHGLPQDPTLPISKQEV